MVDGRLTLFLEDLETAESASMELGPGDLVFIPPGIAHALKVARSGSALEFAPDPMDPADTYRHALTS